MAWSWRELQGSPPVVMAGLFVGILVLELAFIASYVGGLSQPTAHDLPVAVVTSGPAAATLVSRVDTASGHQLAASVYPTMAAADRAIRTGRVAGAFRPGSAADTLVAAGAPTPLGKETLVGVLSRLASAEGVPLHTRVIRPLSTRDPEGLASFYLAVGWAVGGYLIGSLLGLARGSTPTWRGLAARVPALLLYAAASGIVGAAILTDFLGVLPGSPWAMAGVGTLTVLAVSLTTGALQRVFGEAGGTGLAIGIFVVLGNPSAGGPFSRWFLTGIWRDSAGLIPTSAATDAVRRLAYFPAAGVGSQLLVIGCWTAGALVVLAAGAAVRSAGSAAGGERRTPDG